MPYQCPECSSTKLTAVGRILVEIEQRHDETQMKQIAPVEFDEDSLMTCSACSYQAATSQFDTNVPVYPLTEYSVCEDCFTFIATGEHEDPEAMEAHIKRELGGRHGHFVTGVKPTEDDPDGEGG